MEPIGALELLRRYPFKSMAGEDLQEVYVTYAGLVGDRAYAFVDRNNRSNFPWMTARQAHEMILHLPRFLAPPASTDEHPSAETFRAEVATPEGRVSSVSDPEFTPFYEARFCRPLELRFSERAMLDALPISLVGLATIRALAEETGLALDHRRFRANFYVRWNAAAPYHEDSLIGATLRVGEKLTLSIVKKDSRCAIITLDPETAQASPEVQEKVARFHENCFGVYAAVLREGIVRAGDAIYAL